MMGVLPMCKFAGGGFRAGSASRRAGWCHTLYRHLGRTVDRHGGKGAVSLVNSGWWLMIVVNDGYYDGDYYE